MRILIIVGLLLANTSLQAADSDKDRSPKLKFKNGPVCMCARGLSEKDIMQSERPQTRQVSNKNSSAQRSQQLEASQKRDSEEK
ncbi:MAG: hypothetical protein OQK98_15495 [Gammaproteobacteria bacterium]|nr:hypothetical protein [Gammaproteobacteria bacterium]